MLREMVGIATIGVRDCE